MALFTWNLPKQFPFFDDGWRWSNISHSMKCYTPMILLIITYKKIHNLAKSRRSNNGYNLLIKKNSGHPYSVCVISIIVYVCVSAFKLFGRQFCGMVFWVCIDFRQYFNKEWWMMQYKSKSNTMLRGSLKIL